MLGRSERLPAGCRRGMGPTAPPERSGAVAEGAQGQALGPVSAYRRIITTIRPGDTFRVGKAHRNIFDYDAASVVSLAITLPLFRNIFWTPGGGNFGILGSKSIEIPLNLSILEVQIALKMKGNDARGQ